MDLRNLRPCNVGRGPRRGRVDYARGSIKPRKLKPPISTGNFFCNESMIFVPRRDSMPISFLLFFVCFKKQNLVVTKSIMPVFLIVEIIYSLTIKRI